MNQSRNILVLTYWNYEDALVQTYTLPYIKIVGRYLPSNYKIYLVTMDKKSVSKREKNIENNIINLSFDYYPFGIRSALGWIKNIYKLSKAIKKNNISTIHAWCTPAGMIGYLLSLLTGKKLIIDSFEPHAEAMVENGGWKKNSLAFKLLFYFEKKQSNKAQYLIATTEGMKCYAKEKYNQNKDVFFVKPACVDLQLFSEKNIKNKELLAQLQLQDKIVAVYAGKFGGIYLDKEVFDFIKVAETYWKGKFRALILSSHTTDYIEQMRIQAGILPETIVHTFVTHSEIPNYIGLADFGLTPVKSVPSKRYCTPIKDGEYWALGLPVIITPNISDDSDIISNYKIGSVLNGLNHSAYLKSITEIDQLLKNHTRQELYKKIRPIAEKYRNFEIAEKVYSEIYGNK